jgi:tellurite resistance protein TerC
MFLRRLGDTFHAHLGNIGIWILAAVLFNMMVWSRMGELKAFQWCSGYVLEWMLSMDNIFVFHLIFQTYQTPPSQIHKAVFVGVIGAVVMRMLFFMLLSSLLHLAHWIRFPFGLLLIWSGVETARGGDDDLDVKDTFLIQMLKRCIGSRLIERYVEGDAAGWGGSGAMFVVAEDGRVQATLLVVVVACLEFTDIIFALDSVSAKVAQIPDQYIAFSSSVLAMYGLRASFFIMQDLVEMFDLLKYGLCIILVFIGFELMLSHYIHLAASTVCIMILSVFVTCVSGSLAKRHYMNRTGTCS